MREQVWRLLVVTSAAAILSGCSLLSRQDPGPDPLAPGASTPLTITPPGVGGQPAPGRDPLHPPFVQTPTGQPEPEPSPFVQAPPNVPSHPASYQPPTYQPPTYQPSQQQFRPPVDPSSRGPQQQTYPYPHTQPQPPVAPPVAAPYQDPVASRAPLDASSNGNLNYDDTIEPAQIVARVGDQHILAGDILPFVRQTLEPHRDKMTPAQFEQQKEMAMVQVLKQAVDAKLMYAAFLRDIPADKLEDAMPQIRRRMSEAYDEKELPDALKKAKVASAQQFDAILRKFGSSLAKHKQQFMERELGRQAVVMNIDIHPEVTHLEMLDYYRENLAEYEFPSRARWEKMTVRFDKTQSEQQAWQAIQVLGNEVRLGGAPLSAVAKRSSQGLDASEGGYHDWTEPGELRSQPIDAAIFQLPPGYLSEIIKDESGFHIVRVVERTAAGRKPFLDAQVEIKKEIVKKKRSEQVAEFVASLRESIPVWTIYDDPSGSNADVAGGATGGRR